MRVDCVEVDVPHRGQPVVIRIDQPREITVPEQLYGRGEGPLPDAGDVVTASDESRANDDRSMVTDGDPGIAGGCRRSAWSRGARSWS